nr:3-keto-5-aminohexanoate cleavage protein [Methanocella paludicola]
MVQLAPTGMVPTRKDSPYVPLTPEEIAEDTYRAYKLGVSSVHVHARDEAGNPTYKKEVYGEIFSAIRRKCPDIIICASTSGRSDRSLEHRAEVLELRPDMASLMMGTVNFIKNPSPNSQEDIVALAKRMEEHGVKPELEAFEPGFVNVAKYLASKGHLRPPLHFNLLLGSLGSMPAEARDLVFLAGSVPPGSTWAATGIGRFQLQVNVASMLMGGHVRVGLEDSLYYSYPEKSLATNEQLVERVARIARELGREIATPAEARAILGLDH